MPSTKQIYGSFPIASNAPSASVFASLQNVNDATAILQVDIFRGLGLQLLASGTWSGTIVVLASMDGGTTRPITVPMVPWVGGASVSAFTANGNWECALGQITHVKAICAGAITGGPVVATLLGTDASKSGRVGAPAGNPVPVTAGVGSPVEASTVPTVVGANLLSTAAASARLGFWFCQNQSPNALQVALDDGLGNNLSVFDLAPGGSASNQQGGSMGSADTGPHLGRIRVYGPVGSAHALRVQ